MRRHPRRRSYALIQLEPIWLPATWLRPTWLPATWPRPTWLPATWPRPTWLPATWLAWLSPSRFARSEQAKDRLLTLSLRSSGPTGRRSTWGSRAHRPLPPRMKWGTHSATRTTSRSQFRARPIPFTSRAARPLCHALAAPQATPGTQTVASSFRESSTYGSGRGGAGARLQLRLSRRLLHFLVRPHLAQRLSISDISHGTERALLGVHPGGGLPSSWADAELFA